MCEYTVIAVQHSEAGNRMILGYVMADNPDHARERLERAVPSVTMLVRIGRVSWDYSNPASVTAVTL